MKIISKSEHDTAQAARNLAGKLQPGDVIFLEGDLGAGKSVFARALIRHLAESPEMEVPSPTFTLVQTYDSDLAPLWHFDLYRIEDADDIFELGWEEAISEGIAIVEWPQRLDYLAPADRLTVRLNPLENNANHRQITIEGQGRCAARFD